LTVGEQTIVGRITGGSIDALTASAVRTLLNVEDGAQANPSDAEIKTAYENNADTNAFTDAEKTKLGYIAVTGSVDLDNVDADHSSLAAHLLDGNNPHSTTKAQVGLTNVTDDRQMKAITVNTDSYVPQWNGTSGDTLKDGLALQTDISDSDTSIPTSGAVMAYIAAYKLDDLADPEDNTDLDTTITAHGLCPKLSNDETEFLNGIGTWTQIVSRYEDTFDNDDLIAGSGSLTITHSLSETHVCVALFDDSDNAVAGPDYLTPVDENNVTLVMKSFGTITGTWTVVVYT
jgi:hypothetical protein